MIIGLTPVILFASSYSTEVWYDSNWQYPRESQEDFTIPNPNPLLGNRYKLIVGAYFTVFQGEIEGNVTIMNKATRENQTFQIYIHCGHIVKWDSDNHVVILPPGEYTIFWQTTPIGVHYYIYSHGWFMIEHDDPQEVNQLQNFITMVSGFIAFFIAIFVIGSFIRRRKEKTFNFEDRAEIISKNRILKENLDKHLEKKVYSVIEPEIPQEIRTGNFERAIQKYSEVSNKQDQALKLFQSAQNDIRAGNSEGVIQKYSEIISLLPNLKEALFERGSLYAKFGQLPEALRDFEELLRKYPFFAAGWYNKSVVLNKLGRSEEAREASETAKILK